MGSTGEGSESLRGRSRASEGIDGIQVIHSFHRAVDNLAWPVDNRTHSIRQLIGTISHGRASERAYRASHDSARTSLPNESTGGILQASPSRTLTGRDDGGREDQCMLRSILRQKGQLGVLFFHHRVLIR